MRKQYMCLKWCEETGQDQQMLVVQEPTEKQHVLTLFVTFYFVLLPHLTKETNHVLSPKGKFIARTIFLLYQNKPARWSYDKLLLLVSHSSTTYSSSHSRQRERGKSQSGMWLKAMMICRDCDCSSGQYPDPKPNFNHLDNYISPKVKQCDHGVIES